MAEPMKNANEIRGVLDGGQLQFRSGGKWIDAGGDADTWLVLLVCAPARDGAYRIKPDGVTEVGACDPACRGNDSESYCVRTNGPYCGVTNPNLAAGVGGTDGR